MPDEFFERPLRSAPTRTGGPSLRAMLLISLAAFASGALLIGWLVYDGRITLKAVPNPPTRLGNAPLAVAAPLPQNTVPAAVMATDARVAALEQRMARLELQTAAAPGNGSRVEALVVALATRRAVEKGMPLGYLVDQLKLRFGDAQPNAVETLIATAATPVTIDQLGNRLDQLGPQLAGSASQDSGWAGFKRQISDLFTVRRGETDAPRAISVAERARLLLRNGQVAAAIQLVERLPAADQDQVKSWLADAGKYAKAMAALDLLETAALLEPVRLHDGTGAAIRQPSPIDPAAPAPEPTGV